MRIHNRKDHILGEAQNLASLMLVTSVYDFPSVDSPPKQVRFATQSGKEMLVQAGPAQFGPELKNNHRVRKIIHGLGDAYFLCIGSS
jgi:hypothetical protein